MEGLEHEIPKDTPLGASAYLRLCDQQSLEVVECIVVTERWQKGRDCRRVRESVDKRTLWLLDPWE
ncbi:MAG: hypothetical protein JW751_10195 [Polyangiaceae bacterium]|nr:hypothetical protein [Polyangiaceae bacterium]